VLLTGQNIKGTPTDPSPYINFSNVPMRSAAVVAVITPSHALFKTYQHSLAVAGCKTLTTESARQYNN